ncbi:MAG: methionine synthase [Chloroflexi bacterium]|nr:methionine synthase [Chloroflexota bacterium]
MPHTSPEAAHHAVLSHLKEVPAWPQFPRRSYLESIYVQFSQGLPGLVVEEERAYVERAGSEVALEALYQAYLEGRADAYPITAEYAAGLHLFLQDGAGSPRAIKGQMTGPVSLGLALCDRQGRPILYDEVLADALARLLRLKAAWQEKELRKLAPSTIIFVDEPYFASLGSAFVAVEKEKALSWLEEVLGGLRGLKGVHCCGNTDWSLILASSADVLSLDAYEYAQSLSLYPEEVGAFLKRGSVIAWGIVPTREATLAGETAPSLFDRLEEAIEMTAAKGFLHRDLVERSFVTPACGLATLSEGAAERALELLAALSLKIRRKYNLG